MNKLLKVLASSMVITVCAASPALADSSAVKSICSVPLSAMGVIAGCAVGTPIAMVRYTGRDVREMIQEFKGSTPSWKIFGLPEGIFPIAVFQGMAQGFYHGPKNAISNCVDAPFGKDAFSLGDLQ